MSAMTTAPKIEIEIPIAGQPCRLLGKVLETLKAEREITGVTTLEERVAEAIAAVAAASIALARVPARMHRSTVEAATMLERFATGSDDDADAVMVIALREVEAEDAPKYCKHGVKLPCALGHPGCLCADELADLQHPDDGGGGGGGEVPA